MYYVYIIECKDKTLYTGITTDIIRRFNEHKTGKGGAYTRAKKVRLMLYYERHKDRSSASKRESEIKKMSRAKKINLINTNE